MARERYGNGYKGRGGTRRRMRARNRRYVGSARSPANRRMAHYWTIGKGKAWR
jgi:hypothetical protein